MKIKPRTVNAFKDFFLVVPALVFLLVLTYYPIIDLVRISFTNWNLINDDYNYVGARNWIWLFKGSGTRYFLSSLRITALYTAGEIAITLGGGIFLALLFNKVNRAFSVMRAVVFMPRYVAMSSAAVVFLWLLNSEHGILNYFLQIFGIHPVNWLGQRETALISVLMLTGWRAIGYGMMIYLSAIRGISRDYYEAAELDGASAFQRFTGITLPLLSPTTIFLFVTTFISSMKVFQSVDILTGGGPYRSTEVMVYQIYRYSMVDFRMDRAATVAIVFFVILLAFTALTMRVSRGSVHYDA
ncbi:MAG: sugar ABC transporter permease [Treponema sp.]|jgi:multiple sugar transport system permease protein/sn-glycerol 3-phosphate transport system permease protein|nr:sugar ABC transporter permease [Treponema sp.]